jgi:peptidoglycan/LPS O-acetylase OafA/YrhL
MVVRMGGIWRASARVRAALSADVQLRPAPAFPPLVDRYAPETAPIARHQFATLDGLRGTAAIGVASLHLGPAFGSGVLPNAHLAVDFFLQLSGFIVAYAYGARIAAGMRLSTFARLRIGRLYPAFLLGMILGIFALSTTLDAARVPQLWCVTATHTLMLPQVCGLGAQLYPLNAPMWSILFEVLFSFMFFFAAAWLLRRRYAVLAAGLTCVALFWLAPQTLDGGSRSDTLAIATLRLGFSFLLGIAVYSIGITVRRRSTTISVLLPLLLLGLLLFPDESRGYELLLVTLAFPAIIVCGIVFHPAHDGTRSVLLQLGVLSYMLYAIHVPVYRLVYGSIDPAFSRDAGAGFALLVTLIVVSWVLARTYEPWARGVFDRLTTRRPAPAEGHPLMSKTKLNASAVPDATL